MPGTSDEVRSSGRGAAAASAPCPPERGMPGTSELVDGAPRAGGRDPPEARCGPFVEDPSLHPSASRARRRAVPGARPVSGRPDGPGVGGPKAGRAWVGMSAWLRSRRPPANPAPGSDDPSGAGCPPRRAPEPGPPPIGGSFRNGSGRWAAATRGGTGRCGSAGSGPGAGGGDSRRARPVGGAALGRSGSVQSISAVPSLSFRFRPRFERLSLWRVRRDLVQKSSSFRSCCGMQTSSGFREPAPPGTVAQISGVEGWRPTTTAG